MRRLIGLVLLALAIVGGVNYVSHRSQPWPGATGNAAYDSGRAAGRTAAPFVMGALGLLGLWLTFAGDADDAPPPPVRRREVGGLPTPGDPSLRGGQNTFASNPVRVRLDLWRWLSVNSWVPSVAGGLALFGLLMLGVAVPVGIILICAGTVFFLRHVSFAKQKFWGGDVCPGIVLSAQQNLVAVYTDLAANSREPRPAIKILKQPLHRIVTEPAYDGMRVAAAALYRGNARSAAWVDFMPEVISCVSQDPDEIARVLSSIRDDEWQALDQQLSKIPVANLGLYPLWYAGEPVAETASVRSWIQRGFGVTTLVVMGGIIGLWILLKVVLLVGHGLSHRNTAASPRLVPVGAAPNPQNPFAMTQTGPFQVGSKVEAQWAGELDTRQDYGHQSRRFFDDDSTRGLPMAPTDSDGHQHDSTEVKIKSQKRMAASLALSVCSASWFFGALLWDFTQRQSKDGWSDTPLAGMIALCLIPISCVVSGLLLIRMRRKGVGGLTILDHCALFAGILAIGHFIYLFARVVISARDMGI